jgi:hypothetical protein
MGATQMWLAGRARIASHHYRAGSKPDLTRRLRGTGTRGTHSAERSPYARAVYGRSGADVRTAASSTSLGGDGSSGSPGVRCNIPSTSS